MLPRPPISTLFPYTTLFRSHGFPSRGPQSIQPVPASSSPCGGPAGQLPAPVHVRFHREAQEKEGRQALAVRANRRSEEHTSELQSHVNLVCRLLLEKKKHVV